MDVQLEGGEPLPGDSQPTGKIRKGFKLFGKRKSGSIFTMRSKGDGNNKASPITGSKTLDGLVETTAADSELEAEKELWMSQAKEEQPEEEPVGEDGVLAAAPPPTSTSSAASAKSLSFLSLLRGGKRGGGGHGRAPTVSQPAPRQRRGIKELFGSIKFRQKDREEKEEAPPSPLLMSCRSNSVEILKEDLTLTPRPQTHSLNSPGPETEPSDPTKSLITQDSSATTPSETTSPQKTTGDVSRSNEHVPPVPARPPPLEPGETSLSSLLADISSLLTFDSISGGGDIMADVEAEWGKASSTINGLGTETRVDITEEKPLFTTTPSSKPVLPSASTSSPSVRTTAKPSPLAVPITTSIQSFTPKAKPTVTSSLVTKPSSVSTITTKSSASTPSVKSESGRTLAAEPATPIMIQSTSTPTATTKPSTTPITSTIFSTTPATLSSFSTTPATLSSFSTTPATLSSFSTTPVTLSSFSTTPATLSSFSTTPATLSSFSTTPATLSSFSTSLKSYPPKSAFTSMTTTSTPSPVFATTPTPASAPATTIKPPPVSLSPNSTAVKSSPEATPVTATVSKLGPLVSPPPASAKPTPVACSSPPAPAPSPLPPAAKVDSMNAFQTSSSAAKPLDSLISVAPPRTVPAQPPSPAPVTSVKMPTTPPPPPVSASVILSTTTTPPSGPMASAKAPTSPVHTFHPVTMTPPVSKSTPTPISSIKPILTPEPVPTPISSIKPILTPEPDPTPISSIKPILTPEPVPTPISSIKPILTPEPVPTPISSIKPILNPEPVPASLDRTPPTTTPPPATVSVEKKPTSPTPAATPLPTSSTPILIPVSLSNPPPAPAPSLAPTPALLPAIPLSSAQVKGSDVQALSDGRSARPNGTDIQGTRTASPKTEELQNESHTVPLAEKRTPPVKASGISKIPVVGGGRAGRLPVRDNQSAADEGNPGPTSPVLEEESPHLSLQDGGSKYKITDLRADVEACVPTAKHSQEESQQLHHQPKVVSSSPRDSKIPVKLGVQSHSSSHIPQAREAPRTKIPVSKVPVRRMGTKPIATATSTHMRK